MKKNIFNFYSIFFGGLVLIFCISSCKKNFLDRQPLGRYVESDVPAGSFDSKVFAMYAGLRSYNLNGNLAQGIENYRDDLSKKGSSAGDNPAMETMYDRFEYNKSDGGINNYWNDLYAVIIDANSIINGIDSMTSPDPNTMINLGEAKTLRAWSYLRLTKAFGEVPLFTVTVEDASQVNVPKSQVGDIYQQIQDDLNDAATLLPESWNSPYVGRLTKGAALTMLTDIYLWQKNWAGALGTATQIISSGRYHLVDNYRSQFNLEGENGPESIFEIQAYYSQTQNLGLQYAQAMGVRGAGQWNLGWGWNVPTQKLVDEFEPGDVRKAATILYSGQADPFYGQTVPSYPDQVVQPYWNMKVYTNPADRQRLGNLQGYWMNHRIYRYADVLLMGAEAANEIGGDANHQQAVDWLEEVRARARGGNAGVLPKVTTDDKDEFRKAIQHERIVELGMEEKRFYDLVRWGLDVEVLSKLPNSNYTERNRYLPIPQVQIDQSGGTLIQNPDYE